ncbi:hypothetical protein [Nocardia blacklockiae]|uniref:hypothetical protein n=1 Tax=Nocardia blacklockiae TaxID=480036 RepID=UPI001895A06E|nr:hypothetical protein [Nocardia blacklockiae]MBF6176131.1 hypothetical protein [Nocardia blacklockiae]
MSSLPEFVRDAVRRSVATGDGTAVIDTGSGVVQWLSAAGSVFHIEVAYPDHQRRRSLWQRLRGGSTPAAGFTERQLASLGTLGFAELDSAYVLRADGTGLDHDHVVHVVVTVLRDVLRAPDVATMSAEVF